MLTKAVPKLKTKKFSEMIEIGLKSDSLVGVLVRVGVEQCLNVHLVRLVAPSHWALDFNNGCNLSASRRT